MTNKGMGGIPIREMIVCALLLSLMIIMAFTPIGFINLGIVSVTLVHLPVLVGLLCQGLGIGLVLGASFGILSMIRALLPLSPLDPLFINPLVALLPRILFPLLAWGAYRLVKRLLARWPKAQIWASYAAAALIGTLANTGLVLLLLYWTSAAGIVERLSVSRSAVGATLGAIALSNGLPEAALSVIVVPPLVMAIRKALRIQPL